MLAVALLPSCAAQPKPATEWTDPDQNRCGFGRCIRADEWQSAGPNPCPCFEDQCRKAVAVYFTDVQTRQILRMEPDGSAMQVLVMDVDAHDLDIDVAHRKLYWP